MNVHAQNIHPSSQAPPWAAHPRSPLSLELCNPWINVNLLGEREFPEKNSLQ